jgi:hypothetical protein
MNAGGKTSEVLVQWSGMPASLATWENAIDLQSRFPQATAWGEAASVGGGMSATLSCQMVNRRFQLVGLNSLRECAVPTRASSDQNGLEEIIGPVVRVQESCVCVLSAGARVDAGHLVT